MVRLLNRARTFDGILLEHNIFCLQWKFMFTNWDNIELKHNKAGTIANTPNIYIKPYQNILFYQRHFLVLFVWFASVYHKMELMQAPFNESKLRCVSHSMLSKFETWITLELRTSKGGQWTQVCSTMDYGHTTCICFCYFLLLFQYLHNIFLFFSKRA